MEILISIVAKIAEYLVTPLVHPCTYLCSYKTNCENLKNEIRKLKVARDSVQQRVDASKIKGEEIERNVEGWLISVEKIIDEVGKVIEEEEKSNHQCFKGLCPNFKNRYHLSKKAVKEVKAISGLRGEGRFEQVSHPTIPEEIWLKTSQGYMQFESRKLILNGILDALRNPQLLDLKSLTSFCSGNYTFNFSSMKILYVKDCPKKKIFFKRDLNTPMLHKVHSNYKFDEGC